MGRISIDIRPSIVAERSRLGDWEADTVEGSKGGPVLVTLAERKSRLFLFGKAPNKSASEVRRVIEGLLTPIKDFVQTITYDNGKSSATMPMCQLHSRLRDFLRTPTIRGSVA